MNQLKSFLWLSFLSVSLSGCGLISYSSNISYTDAEGHIPENTLKEIRKNKTSKKWLVLNLGEPIHHEKGLNYQELMTWELSQKQRKRFNFLFIFHYGKSSAKNTYMHALLERGVVKKRWFDQHQYIDRADLGKHFSSPRHTAAVSAEKEAAAYPREEKKKSFWRRFF